MPASLWRAYSAVRSQAFPISDVSCPGVTSKTEFLYLYDYRDEWHFGDKLRHLSDRVETGAQYPRVVDQQGEAPHQYPNMEEDDWDEDDHA